MKCRIGRKGRRDGVCIYITPVAPSPNPVKARKALSLKGFVHLCAACCFLLAAPQVAAQEDLEHRSRLAFSQNLADYLLLGTLNADVQYSVHRSWTLQAGAKYNNWTWRYGQDAQFESRQQAYYVGARWWPWYTYSGWWVGAKMQYKEYNRGGLLSSETEEGDAFGLSFGGGRSIHVNRWLNVDVGLYGWGGLTKYVTYACPYCGQRTDEGTKAFFLPDEARIALQFVF